MRSSTFISFFCFHFSSYNSPISRLCPSGDASYGERPRELVCPQLPPLPKRRATNVARWRDPNATSSRDVTANFRARRRDDARISVRVLAHARALDARGGVHGDGDVKLSSSTRSPTPSRARPRACDTTLPWWPSHTGARGRRSRSARRRRTG